MKPGTTGYGSAGTAVDTQVSDANGHFTFNQPSCSSAHEVWFIIAHGGDTGTGVNSLSTLMAVLGPCNQAPNSVVVNEVTTAASTYALSQFMDTALNMSSNVGTSSTNALGLANAAGTVRNLVDVTTGAAPGPALPTGATAPVAQINTLANILSTCVQISDSSASTACKQLVCLATPGGTWNGTNCSVSAAAATTLDAALLITRNPANNVFNLFALQPGSPPFTPDLSAAPNDWTMGVKYTNGLPSMPLSSPFGLAIDSVGNVWVANFSVGAVSKLGPTGVALSGTSGIVGGGLSSCRFLAIDSLDNVWVTNSNNSISEISSAGVPLSPSNGYTGGGLSNDYGVAIDSGDRVWVSNATSGPNSSISLFCGATTASCPASFVTGQPISPSSGFTGGGLNGPEGIAVDGQGNAWTVSIHTNPPDTLSEFNSSGTPLSGTGFTGGGLAHPTWLAFDTAGNAWIANIDGPPSAFNSSGAPLAGSPFSGGAAGNSLGVQVDSGNHIWVSNEASPIGSISEFSGSGTPLSPAGFQASRTLNDPVGIGIDASGNLWAANEFDGSVTQIVGVATPTKPPVIGLPQLP